MTTPRHPEVFSEEGIRRDATVEELIAALSAYALDNEKDTEIEATTTAPGNSTDDSVQLLKLLLEKGADPNSLAGDTSLLHVAAELGDRQAVELLLDRGARIEGVKKKTGDTALHLAARSGHEDTVRILLDRGAKIETKDNDGQTALHLAARNGHEDTLRLLLDRGAEIEAIDENGCKALHLAARNGLVETVRLLLDRGSEIQDQEYDMGRTPLFLAAIEAVHEAAVRLLLDRGASWETPEWGGCDVLEAAILEGHEAIAQILRQHGARSHSDSGPE
jgi:ankyrin repeat protein